MSNSVTDYLARRGAPPPMTGAIGLKLATAAPREPGTSLDTAIRPADEPIFTRLVAEWGCPLVDVPWTGHRPEQVPVGRVLGPDETGPVDAVVIEVAS